MPILCPNNHPSVNDLSQRGIIVMDQNRADHQDIRPLKIGIVNLMPLRLQTEYEIFKLLGNTPLQIDARLIDITESEKHQQHLDQFYMTWKDAQTQKFDAVIITGANVETMSFEQVSYRNTLKEVFDWSDNHVTSLMGICRGAQAGMYHYNQITKQILGQKLLGVYQYRNPGNHWLLTGMDDTIPMPVARATTTNSQELGQKSDLSLLLDHPVSGPGIIVDDMRDHVWITGHMEYSRGALAKEYLRDLILGHYVPFPEGYFPGRDLVDDFAQLSVDDKLRIIMSLTPDHRDIIFSREYFRNSKDILRQIDAVAPYNLLDSRWSVGLMPVRSWNANARTLFGNWINHIYDKTPFNLKDVGIS